MDNSDGAVDVPVVPRAPLDIEDYLDASGDASRRSRGMILVIAVASILAFAGLLNSLESSWMRERVMKLHEVRGVNVPELDSDTELGRYVAHFVGDIPRDADQKAIPYNGGSVEWQLYMNRYKAFCDAVERAFVDNSMTVRVPFLGIGFDVNDLSLLSSVGFVIILASYRFFLSREVDNLRISFTEAKAAGVHKLDEFYKLLAMRQVFTVPTGTFVTRGSFLRVAPKVITWLPFAVLIAIIANDVHTVWVAHHLGRKRFYLSMICACSAGIFLAWLSYAITQRLRLMDQIWEKVWCFISDEMTKPGIGIWDLRLQSTAPLLASQLRQRSVAGTTKLQ